MGGVNYGLIEMGFTGSVVLGFAIWQLVSVNREIAKDKAAAQSQATVHPERSRGTLPSEAEAPDVAASATLGEVSRLRSTRTE